MTGGTTPDEDLLIRTQGRVGRLTLNRPKALNALTYAMALRMEEALRAWQNDPTVELVLIDAAGDKAFCAGGDIRDLYDTGRSGDFEFGRRFWADEYRLNALIKTYPKPFVAIMDGITMGGGVGISAHGSLRIVGDRTLLAMPECSIGLIPDVGGTLILGHAPGHIGEYVGLTGARLGPADAIYAGFADLYVPSGRLEALKAALVDQATPKAAEAFAEDPAQGELQVNRQAIDAVFSAPHVPDIIASLHRLEAPWAEKALKGLNAAAPLALACGLEAIRAARSMTSIAEALAQEYRFVWRAMEEGEFLEGIRAAVIDKDRTPHWARPTFEDLQPADIKAMLAPLGPNELAL
ncbi:MAG: enoyl-CoA hydratase/isomerase family protein [Pseudomonadota bacterium]